MAGFIRRYGFMPSQDQIQQIEGVIIIDLPPPGQVQATGVGTAAEIGEFEDVTNAVLVDGNGNVTTKIVPTEVFSSQDMANKFGTWDETLGAFGTAGGNGYVGVRGKRFSRLVLVAVNNASAKAARAVRALPTNQGATTPLPAVAMQGALATPGTQFRTGGGNRVRIAGPVKFTDTAAYAVGTDGSFAAAAAAGFQTFTSPSIVPLIAAGTIKVGDIIVLGVVGDATYGVGGIMGTYHGTFRVRTAPVGGPITIEQLDGSTWAVPAQGTIPWRLHAAATADSAGGGNGQQAGATYATLGGYTVPARPLDATIAGGSIVPPTLVPPVPTATTWDPLSDLTFIAQPTSPANDIVYTAAVQAPNAANSAALDALYTTAFDALLTEDSPGREVNLVWAARTSPTIRSYGKAHALVASGRGVGRAFITRPELSVQNTPAAAAATDPGVGANRDERTWYAWPSARSFIPEAVGVNVGTAIGTLTADGMLDVGADGFLASLLSVLPPERNPGQGASPVPEALSLVLGLQRGVSGLTINDYALMRQNGIIGLRFDKDLGSFIFQSGRTSSLVPGQLNINRRRMADYIEDNLARIYKPFSKLPMTTQLQDLIASETVSWLDGLLSPNNPSAQQIADYMVDDRSGNTPDSKDKGIFVVITRVQTLSTMDFIVLQAEIGENVKITQQ